MTLTACLDCGEPCESTRCDYCRPAQERLHRQGRPDRKSSPESRGYDSRWKKLSKRARELQPWCTDCGTTDDLQSDHSTEAWERKAAGLSLRLADVEVVCGPCNRARGAQRPNQTPQGACPQAPEGPPPGSEAIFPSHTVGLSRVGG